MIYLFNFSNLLSTCFGIGLISRIPAVGTVVSLLSIIPWYILHRLFCCRFLFVILVLISILGCYVCHQTNKSMGVHDHKCIVLDEFIGMWFVLILLPYDTDHFLLLLFLGFIFFRVFDIFKPWLISTIDRNIKNGLGIILDDIVSAIISVVLIYLITYIYDL